MVGVPGRSKACYNCRRRKKGCDSLPLGCTQCQKAGIVCLLYNKQHIFVNSSTGLVDDGTPQHSEKPCLLRQRYTPRCVLGIGLPESLNTAAYEFKCVGLFRQLYLPYGRMFTPKAVQYSEGGWTTMAHRSYHNSQALRLALGALSCSLIGKEFDEDWMVHKGLVLYGRALQELKVILSIPIRAASNIAILVSRLLGTFEVLFGGEWKNHSAQVTAWRHHNSGVAALFLLRKPNAFVSGDAHSLFADLRLHIAISSIQRAERTFLNESPWKNIPWSQTHKTVKDDLIDIIVKIPELLEELATLRKFSGSDYWAESWQQLTGKFKDCMEQLDQWYFEAGPSIFCQHLVQDNTGVAAAHLLATYWGIRLLFHDALPTNGVLKTVRPSDEEASVLSINISSILPQLINEKSGWFGRHIAAFSIGRTMRAFDTLARSFEIADSKKSFSGLLTDRGCQAVMDFVESLQSDVESRPGKQNN